MKLLKSTVYIFLFVFFLTTNSVKAQVNQYFKAIVKEKSENLLKVEFIEETQKKQIDIEILPESQNYKPGDKVLVHKEPFNNQYFVTDHIRTDGLLTLFALFLIVIYSISKKPGIYSMIGMSYSFLIILKVMLPNLLAGRNTLLVTMFSALLIAPATFIISHGANKKTYIALGSTLLALLITIMLASLSLSITHLTGFGTEEAYFLQLANNNINMKGILLAGIIIGTLGILDDVTVTQASLVEQLRDMSKRIGTVELFNKAMKVGHDHISSTVNTLVLVYTGAALPLLLLFFNSNTSFIEVINSQIIAEEIVTMLVSSIGLVISIPITTFVAAQVFTFDKH